VIARAPIAQLD